MTNLEYAENVHKYKCPFDKKSLFFVIGHSKRHRFELELSTCETTSLEKYYCKSCNFQTDLIIIFNQHVRQFHGKKRESVYSPSTKNSAVISYICKTCTFETHSILFWMKHLESSCFSKSDDFEHVRLSLVTLADHRWYQCDYCQYRTWRKGNLKHHVLFKHTTSEAVQWFTCEKCQYKSKTKYDLNRHAKLHLSNDDVQWFKCDKLQI
jgi:hypothetical protein